MLKNHKGKRLKKDEENLVARVALEETVAQESSERVSIQLQSSANQWGAE